jgi:hypothetical protein
MGEKWLHLWHGMNVSNRTELLSGQVEAKEAARMLEDSSMYYERLRQTRERKEVLLGRGGGALWLI